MTQCGERLGLTLEALLQVGIAGNVFRQDLDGNCAIETGFGRLIDFSHPAGTNRGGNRIRAKPRARGQRHGRLRCVRILQAAQFGRYGLWLNPQHLASGLWDCVTVPMAGKV